MIFIPSERIGNFSERGLLQSFTVFSGTQVPVMQNFFAMTVSVSRICQIMDERILGTDEFLTNVLVWTRADRRKNNVDGS